MRHVRRAGLLCALIAACALAGSPAAAAASSSPQVPPQGL